jgi:hypothetical protein
VVLTTSFGYDADDRVTQQVDAYGNTLQRATTIAWDAAGNLVSVTDPLNIFSTYGYAAGSGTAAGDSG